MRTKTKKYEALGSFDNVYQLSSGIGDITITNNGRQINIDSQADHKSENITDIYNNITRWVSKVVIEVCCGAGDYALGLARLDRNSDVIYIWVDIKWDRLYKWVNLAIAEWLDNVAWIRGDIRQLTRILWSGGVDELWITFPDPQLGDKNEHNRVTNSKFIDIYQQLLKPDGKLCIKTDDAEFADYTRLVLKDLWADIYIDIPDVVSYLEMGSDKNLFDKLSITTRYEDRRRKMGKKIQFISAKFD